MHKNSRAYIALLITAVLWGIAPSIIKYTLNFTTAANFLFFRFVIASTIVIIPLIIALIKVKPSLNDLIKIILLGALGTPLALYLLFAGVDKTSAIESSVIWILSPTFIVIGSVIFLKEKIEKAEKIGLGLVLTGTALTIIIPLISNGFNFNNFQGNILVLAGTVCWSVYSLLVKKFNSKTITPFILTASSFIVALICFFPLSINQWSNVLSQAWPGIFYMALFGSVFAYLGYTYGISKIEVSEASIFTHLQPIFGIPVAMILLGEKINLLFVCGAIFITLGVVISERKTKRS